MGRMGDHALEADEQIALFEWARYSEGRYPELKMMFHVPNGGSRNIVEARNLKRQGVKAGVPDIFLALASNGYHGLFIEMKRPLGGRVSDQQTEWLVNLRAEGYAAYVCQGCEAARRLIMDYISGRELQNGWVYEACS